MVSITSLVFAYSWATIMRNCPRFVSIVVTGIETNALRIKKYTCRPRPTCYCGNICSDVMSNLFEDKKIAYNFFTAQRARRSSNCFERLYMDVRGQVDLMGSVQVQASKLSAGQRCNKISTFATPSK